MAEENVIPFILDLVAVSIVSLLFLSRYVNLKQNRLVLLVTYISWYFSFLILFVLPLDVSNVSLTCTIVMPRCKELLRAYYRLSTEFALMNRQRILLSSIMPVTHQTLQQRCLIHLLNVHLL